MMLTPVYAHASDQSGAFTRGDVAGRIYDAHFQTLLDDAVSGGLPGVSLRINGDGVDFQGAAGLADIQAGEAFTPDHAMFVASLGKTFTATVALQLCEEGWLDLDAPVSYWLPVAISRRIPASEKITLRHLLNHTSGLFDYMNDARNWRADFARDPHREWGYSDILAYLYDRPLHFRPGTRFDYSNSNYILLGLIIERVTGRPLHALMRERILDPLGLRHTFNARETGEKEKRVHGYFKDRGRVIDTYPWYSHYGLANSGMHSTPGDLALFIRALFSSDSLLSESTRSEMTRVPASAYPASKYGMGIYILHNPRGAGLHWYMHDGIDPGYRADMMYIPDVDLSIVLFTNTGMGRADSIYEDLLEDVVQAVLDIVIRRSGLSAK